MVTQSVYMQLELDIYTTTPAGLMMMQMLGSVAEFERQMIRERTRSGLAYVSTSTSTSGEIIVQIGV